MKIKNSKSGIAFDIFNMFFMFFMVVITLYPFIYILFGSFSDSGLLMRNSGVLWKPEGFSLEGYKAVLNNEDIFSGYANTLFYIIVGTSLSIIVSSLLAFTLSRSYLKHTKGIMVMIVVTMFFDGGMIPTFLLVRGLGLINSRWAVIIPTLISTYNLIVLKTSFASIPASIEESAYIDGASAFTVLFKFVIPLSKAAIAVQILFYGVGIWNSWFNAMIYLKDRNLYPIQLILREILIDSSAELTAGSGADDKASLSDVIKYATVVITTVPILCVYPFLQKYFVKGVMIGAVKG